MLSLFCSLTAILFLALLSVWSLLRVWFKTYILDGGGFVGIFKASRFDVTRRYNTGRIEDTSLQSPELSKVFEFSNHSRIIFRPTIHYPVASGYTAYRFIDLEVNTETQYAFVRIDLRWPKNFILLGCKVFFLPVPVEFAGDCGCGGNANV